MYIPDNTSFDVCLREGMIFPGKTRHPEYILKILRQRGLAAYCIASRDVLGCVLPGVLTTRGQRGVAEYYIASLDVLSTGVLPTQDS